MGVFSCTASAPVTRRPPSGGDGDGFQGLRGGAGQQRLGEDGGEGDADGDSRDHLAARQGLEHGSGPPLPVLATQPAYGRTGKMKRSGS